MNSRKIVTNILTEVLNKGAYSNIVLNNTFNKYDLKAEDKGLITEIVYGTIKYKYTIDHILHKFIGSNFNKNSSFIINLLRSSIYQIKYLDRIPDYAVVSEAVNISKEESIRASKFVNAVLRNYLRNKEIEPQEGNEVSRTCIEYSFEKWMVDLFIKQYGLEITKQILKGLNEVPSVTVRINTFKTSFEEVWNKLLEAGYNIEKGEVCSEAIRIIHGRSIEHNELFKAGYITVQDESAMLTSSLLDIKDNMEIADLCSAPGGKTTHISELLNNTGKVFAFDLHPNKLGLIEQNYNRLGLSNIVCDALDATNLNESLIEKMDRVLVDAPCSGLGIIRKKPEIKWTKSNKDLKELTEIQKKILMNASQYLKVGGVLVYSTCTLNKFENEKVIEWFIKNNSNFTIEKIDIGSRSNLIYDSKGMLTILPNENMDGFFITKLKKVR
jgi:ribosomal RNA small subunit methyltransferase RsmB